MIDDIKQKYIRFIVKSVFWILLLFVSILILQNPTPSLIQANAATADCHRDGSTWCSNASEVNPQTIDHDITDYTSSTGWQDCLSWCDANFSAVYPICQFNGDGPRNCWLKQAPEGGISACNWQAPLYNGFPMGAWSESSETLYCSDEQPIKSGKFACTVIKNEFIAQTFISDMINKYGNLIPQVKFEFTSLHTSDKKDGNYCWSGDAGFIRCPPQWNTWMSNKLVVHELMHHARVHLLDCGNNCTATSELQASILEDLIVDINCAGGEYSFTGSDGVTRFPSQLLAYFSSKVTSEAELWDFALGNSDTLSKYMDGIIPGSTKFTDLFKGGYKIDPTPVPKISPTIPTPTATQVVITPSISATPLPTPTTIPGSLGLYHFVGDELYCGRPGGGPLTVLFTRDNVKWSADNLNIISWSKWQSFFEQSNKIDGVVNEVAVSNIITAGVGPSFGLEGDKLKMISLGWAGGNVIEILGVTTGTDVINGEKQKVQWGLVSGIPSTYVPDPSQVNPYTHPEWFGTYRIYSKSTPEHWNIQKNASVVPLLGQRTWWVPMRYLEPVNNELPKQITVIEPAGILSRIGPGVGNAEHSYYVKDEKLTVYEVMVGTGGGLWGRITNTQDNAQWIELRYQERFNSWPTDWQI